MLDDANQINKLFLNKKDKTFTTPGVLQNDESFNVYDNSPLIPIEDHPFWQKIDTDAEYREEIIQFMLSNLENTWHTHRKYVHNFIDLKVKD